MGHNTKNHWTYGLYHGPEFSINRKEKVSERGSSSFFRGVKGNALSVGSL
jgi:hypothetical protein